MHQTTRLAINLNPLSKDPFVRANSSELKFKECYNIYPTSMPTIPQTTKNGGGNNNIFSKYNKQTNEQSEQNDQFIHGEKQNKKKNVELYASNSNGKKPYYND